MIFNLQHDYMFLRKQTLICPAILKSIEQTLLEDELVPVFLSMMFFFTVTIQEGFSQEHCWFFTLL